jgi:hypothetical protein
MMSKICQPGIDKPNIRDEIFCQLLRQTHKNMKPYHCLPQPSSFPTLALA